MMRRPGSRERAAGQAATQDKALNKKKLDRASITEPIDAE
jgi:hypothetical protein